jgi:predicted transcriptional regulator
MTASTTMTIRVRPDVKEKLDRIANDTQRSKSFLAGEAVAEMREVIEEAKRRKAARG